MRMTLVATLVAVVLTILALWLQLPLWLVVVVVAGLLLWWRWAAEQQMLSLASDPELQERAAAACRQAGYPAVLPSIVTAKGMPYLRQRGKRLLLSKRLGEILSADELTAMIAYQLVRGAAAARWSAWLHHLPWALVLATMAVEFWWPLDMLVYILLWALVIGLIPGTYRGTAVTRAASRAAGRFLADGGDAEALLRAYFRIYREHRAVLTQSPEWRFRLRRFVQAVAEQGGLAQARLSEIGLATDAPPELYLPDKDPAWWRRPSVFLPGLLLTLFLLVFLVGLPLAVWLS